MRTEELRELSLAFRKTRLRQNVFLLPSFFFGKFLLSRKLASNKRRLLVKKFAESI